MASRAKFSELAKDVNEFMRGQNPSHNDLSLEEVAMGFIEVANESMCRPIRALTQVNNFLMDLNFDLLPIAGLASIKWSFSTSEILT